jgi:MSHA biogenesis protein MshG
VASFSYRGRDGAGQGTEGVIEAESASAAAGLLAERGIVPLSIAAASSGAVAAGAALKFDNPFREKVQHSDILLFSRQIYTLLKAGVPLMRALLGLQESSTSKPMKAVIGDIRQSLDAGRELSMAMAPHKTVFTPFYLAMVRVGELTGQLEEIFLRLFYHLEFERFMREQVRSALRYPSFVVAAMAVAILVINIWVIPAFARVFEGFGADLPLMTKILVGFSNFVVAGWPYLIGGLVAVVLGFRAWVATERGRYHWDRIKMKLPVAGRIVQKATLARFARSFALASKSGVPVVQALTTVAQTVDNAYIADKVMKMRESVERGESVLRAAIASRVFTPVVLQMIAVGEESGSLDDMMEEVAGLYQREVEYDLKNLGASIEPILITFLGVLVLILALGVFLPIWDLGKAAFKR